jgi:hypothetical protein
MMHSFEYCRQSALVSCNAKPRHSVKYSLDSENFVIVFLSVKRKLPMHMSLCVLKVNFMVSFLLDYSLEQGQLMTSIANIY